MVADPGPLPAKHQRPGKHRCRFRKAECNNQHGGCCQPKDQVRPARVRAKQDELAIAINKEIHGLGIGITRHKAFSQKDPQVARERRITLINAFILTYRAPQAFAQFAGAILENGVFKDLVRLHSPERPGSSR